MKRGARGIPAHGEFLFGPGALHRWCSGKSQGGAALDQGGPLRSSARPSRPKPASITATARMQCNPSLGEGVRVTSSSYRTLRITPPSLCTPTSKVPDLSLSLNVQHSQESEVQDPRLSSSASSLKLREPPTLRAQLYAPANRQSTQKGAFLAFPPTLTSRILGCRLWAPRAAASALRQPRCFPPRSLRRVPRSKARSPASF